MSITSLTLDADLKARQAESKTFLHVVDRFSAQRIVPLGADVQYRINASELTEVGVPNKALNHIPSKAEHYEHLL